MQIDIPTLTVCFPDNRKGGLPGTTPSSRIDVNRGLYSRGGPNAVGDMPEILVSTNVEITMDDLSMKNEASTDKHQWRTEMA